MRLGHKVRAGGSPSLPAVTQVVVSEISAPRHRPAVAADGPVGPGVPEVCRSQTKAVCTPDTEPLPRAEGAAHHEGYKDHGF